MNVYIAPPFGTYVRLKHARSVHGSTTVLSRPGRFDQIVRTVRRVRGAWVNEIGLRNPGIGALTYEPGVFFSVAGIDDGDWERLADALALKRWPCYLLELNLSCPNVAEYGHPSIEELTRFARLPSAVVIAKLPPDVMQALALTELCLTAGIRHIHLSNTLPSPIGGVSGWPLLRQNLKVVEAVARSTPLARIIAGGGATSMLDWQRYQNAGARDVSLGSVFFNPIRGLRLYHELIRVR